MCTLLFHSIKTIVMEKIFFMFTDFTMCDEVSLTESTAVCILRGVELFSCTRETYDLAQRLIFDVKYPSVSNEDRDKYAMQA